MPYNIFSDSLNLSDITLNARTRLLDIFDITFSSRYDPYTSNKEQSKNINQLELNINNRLARLTSLSTTIGLTLNDKTFSTIFVLFLIVKSLGSEILIFVFIII